MNQQSNPFAAPDHGLDRHAQGDNADMENFQYMGFWKRFLAYLIDTILLFLAFLPLSITMHLSITDQGTASLLYNIISSLLGIAVIILFWQFKQATPGKMIFGAKIVDAQTLKKPTIGKLVLRYIAYIPSALVFCLGFIWIAFDKQKRGWHDMMSGTLVITPSPLSDRRSVRRPANVTQRTKPSDN